MQHIETADREKRALIKGLMELGQKKGTILTMDEKRSGKIKDYTINILPVWEWLISTQQA